MATAELLLSPSTGKSPVHSRSYIRVLCFVGDVDDRETQNLIARIKEKWPDTEIVYDPTGFNMLQEKGVVFFFKDFCGEAFEKIAEHNTRIGTRIVGPLYIKSRLILDTGELFCPKINRPLYSVQMASVIVCLSHDLGKERKRLAKYIQYMGGRVKKELQESIRPTTSSQKTCVYVGKENGKLQRTASLLQMKTLKPEWIDFCWSKRNDPNFNVLDKELMREYAIGAFEELKIALVGFTESEYTDMCRNIAPNGGTHVINLSDATHIVCDPNASELSSLELQGHQVAVTDAWFWQSINSLRCLNEDDYYLHAYPALCRAANNHFIKVKSTNSLADYERSKGSDDFSSDDLDAMSPVTRTPNTPNTPKSPKGYDNRQQVILELLETEKNYVAALNLVLKFRTLIEDEWISKEGENPITRADLQMIFGKIPPIISVHSSILEKVQAHVNSWDRNILGTPSSRFTKQTGGDLAEIWIAEKEKLLTAYPAYLNNYESGKSAFETADQSNTRFHVFIRSIESDPSFNRNKLIDLLIRPVQRLPSVILLLKELQKRTDKQEQLKKIGDAAAVVDEILKHANTVRLKSDSKIEHLTRFTNMDKVPDHLICSRRQFISEMDAVSIAGTGDFNKWYKVDVRILLFNDVIVVCKIRDQLNNTSPMGMTRTTSGTLSRLRKQTSLSNIRRTYKKPLKYIKHIPIQYIRDIRETREVNDEGGFSSFSPLNGVPLQVITIREDSYADIVWVIHPQDKSHMELTFKNIHQHVQMEYARNVYSQTPYPLNDLLAMSEVEEPLRKYLRKMLTASHNASALNYTMSRGGSMLRRAISSASMSVATRLSRMATSRSNLREIMEAPHQESEAVTKAVTPAYNAHPRIDAHSSPDLLDSTEGGTPRRGLRARFSTMNLTQSIFNRNASFRRPRPMSPSFEENKEN